MKSGTRCDGITDGVACDRASAWSMHFIAKDTYHPREELYACDEHREEVIESALQYSMRGVVTIVSIP